MGADVERWEPSEGSGGKVTGSGLLWGRSLPPGGEGAEVKRNSGW